MLKALLVDDDRIVLESIAALLSDYMELEVCGMALNAQEALKQIDLHQPDMLFLDVHMPRMDGFEMVSLLPYRLDIIFVTTSEAHAIRAFELNALDYILKPVDPGRLKVTINRLLNQKNAQHETQNYVFAAERGKFQDFIYLPMACSQMFIRADDIHALRSHRNNSRVVMSDGRVFEVRRSLNAWEQRLDSIHFYRINREVILHIRKIKEIVREENEVFCLDEKSNKHLISRRRVAGLTALLSGEPEF